jgi:hypothetical protein
MCSSFIRLVDLIYKDSKLSVAISPTGHGLHHEGLIDAQLAAEADWLRSGTIIAISQKTLLARSRAIAYIFRRSSNPLAKVTGTLITFIPVSIADWLYKFVARNRLSISRLFPSSCALRLCNVTLIADEQYLF